MLTRKWIAYLGAVVALALAAGSAVGTERSASTAVALGPGGAPTSETALCVVPAHPERP